MIMLVCLEAVHGKQREQGDKLQTLPQDIRKGDVAGLLVIRIKCQDAFGERVHHIMTGRF